MRPNTVFTSESVSRGHPDKICDQISDAVLDAALRQNPAARVACETLVKGGAPLQRGLVVLAGEVSVAPEYQNLVRETLRQIGYGREINPDFHADECDVNVCITEQSPGIAQGVSHGEGLHKAQGAGDQGMMFGYACDETPELMPAPIQLAHELIKAHRRCFESGEIPYLRPDAKSQVSVRYGGDGRPAAVDTVVLSAHHAEGIPHAQIQKDVQEKIILPTLAARGFTQAPAAMHVNPTGLFITGGPAADAGLTGRKIIVDTYGGMGRHGGGAFSGKDPSKVDRSAAYAARWVAKNLVAAGVAPRIEVQIAYAIGFPEPVSIYVDTFGASEMAPAELEKLVREHFDLTPAGIEAALDLRRPIYAQTAYHGHFGRAEFPWEKTGRADAIKGSL